MEAATARTTSRSSGRYGWVDVAKGICIVAVVCYYARNGMADRLGATGWLEGWAAFARPFRMPDFFLLSGLFLGAVINRSWRSYLDTKVVHYAYFLAIWVGLIFAYDFWAGNEGTGQPQSAAHALKLYAYYLYRPDHMLWFIQTLPMYFVVTRLLKGLPDWLLFAAAAALRVFDVHTGLKFADNFIEYYVFFLCGYFGAQRIFAMADWVGNHRGTAAAAILAWIPVNLYAVTSGWTSSAAGAVAFGFVGIAAVISLSRLLADLPAFGWLRFLGQNSIVVYLGFYIPLDALMHLYKASGWDIEINLLATGLVVLATLAPTLLFIGSKGTPLRFLFQRPKWAFIFKKNATAAVAA